MLLVISARSPMSKSAGIISGIIALFDNGPFGSGYPVLAAKDFSLKLGNMLIEEGF